MGLVNGFELTCPGMLRHAFRLDAKKGRRKGTRHPHTQTRDRGEASAARDPEKGQDRTALLGSLTTPVLRPTLHKGESGSQVDGYSKSTLYDNRLATIVGLHDKHHDAIARNAALGRLVTFRLCPPSLCPQRPPRPYHSIHCWLRRPLGEKNAGGQHNETSSCSVDGCYCGRSSCFSALSLHGSVILPACGGKRRGRLTNTVQPADAVFVCGLCVLDVVHQRQASEEQGCSGRFCLMLRPRLDRNCNALGASNGLMKRRNLKTASRHTHPPSGRLDAEQ